MLFRADASLDVYFFGTLFGFQEHARRKARDKNETAQVSQGGLRGRNKLDLLAIAKQMQ